ncbi:MAG TPA: hypothetical protein VGR89_13570 [Puia sp.]|nr:hypothetical protein [Puia sp.]
MLLFRHIGKQVAFKAVILLIGLSLFAAQISYKFYQSASMPLAGVSVSGHIPPGYQPASGNFAGHRLTLDKRFDVKYSLALFTPIIRFDHCAGQTQTLFYFPDTWPTEDAVRVTALRGPPSPKISRLS